MNAKQPSTNEKGGTSSVSGSGEGSGPGSGGMLGARIMGLKFMQRRAQQQQQPGDAVPQPAADINGAAALAQTTAARSEFEWTVEPAAAAVRAAAPVRVLHETEAEQPNSREVLLHFRAGRRSFGAFNPRLEKRLAEIGSNQRTAAEELVNGARIAAEQRQKQAERDALVKADDEFAAQNALSDAFLAGHFAARYGKYVPPPPPLPRPAHVEAAAVELPVVENPVRVRDTPFKPPASKKAKRYGRRAMGPLQWPTTGGHLEELYVR